MSVTKQCRHLEVGQTTFIECESIKQSHNVTRRLNLTERMPQDMKGFKFSCMTFTAIALVGADIIYINKVTRTK